MKEANRGHFSVLFGDANQIGNFNFFFDKYKKELFFLIGGNYENIISIKIMREEVL